MAAARHATLESDSAMPSSTVAKIIKEISVVSLRRARAALKSSLFARESLLGARRENISRVTLISSFLLAAVEKKLFSKSLI